MTPEERTLQYAFNRLVRFLLSSRERQLHAYREAREYWQKPHPYYWYWDGMCKAIEHELRSTAKELKQEMTRFGSKEKVAYLSEALVEALKTYDEDIDNEAK